jgi:hypothetical protein
MKWAILVIYYSTNVSGIGDLQTHIAFPSYKQCGQAMMPILDVVRNTYPDAWAHCNGRARAPKLGIGVSKNTEATARGVGMIQ